MPHRLKPSDPKRRYFLADLQYHFEVEIIAKWYIWHSLLSLCWAVWVVSFQSFDSSPSYETLIALGPERYFAGVLFVLGVVTLYGALRRRPALLVVAMGLNCLAWAGVAGLFAHGNLNSTAVVTYGWVAGGHGLSFQSLVAKHFRFAALMAEEKAEGEDP